MSTVEQLAQAFAEEHARRTESRSRGRRVGTVDVEILDLEPGARGTTTVSLVYDFLCAHAAQTDPDWYVHYVYVGTVVLADNALGEPKLEQTRADRLTELAPASAEERRTWRRTARDAWWPTFDEKRRRMRAAAQLVGEVATKRAQSDANDTGGSCAWVPPATPEIVDLEVDGDTTKIWFVFDHLVLHGAQSGSDWYFHFVYVGRGTIEGDALVEFSLEKKREDRVTEHQIEWAPKTTRYDCGAVLKADRDAWWNSITDVHWSDMP